MPEPILYIFLVTTALGTRPWHAHDAQHALEQHNDAHHGQDGEEVISIIRCNEAPATRLFALTSHQGTAMSETVLTEAQFTEANKDHIRETAPTDWDGGDFVDVTENDALADQAVHTNVIDPSFAYLHYLSEKGEPLEQPLSDVSDSGTLIDPETGDDLPIVGVSFINTRA